MKKKGKRRSNQQAKGKELSEAELEQATGGVMQEAGAVVPTIAEAQYLNLQEKMQNENRQFATVSNVLKTKHDTTKNAINNVR
jgi:hypothetical protein